MKWIASLYPRPIPAQTVKAETHPAFIGHPVYAQKAEVCWYSLCGLGEKSLQKAHSSRKYSFRPCLNKAGFVGKSDLIATHINNSH